MSKIKLPEKVKLEGVIIPAGTEIEVDGGPEEVMVLLKRLGQPHMFHYSEAKKEYIHVSKMDTLYLRNVLVQSYQNLIAKLALARTDKELVACLEENDPASTENIKPILRELVRRASK